MAFSIFGPRARNPRLGSRKLSPFEFFRDIASPFHRAIYADHGEFGLIFRPNFVWRFPMRCIGATLPQTLTFRVAAGKPGDERAS